MKLSLKQVEDAIGESRENWFGRCHVISLALVRSGLLGKSRVARGWAKGVTSQHSWAVTGWDCWSRTATIVDPTLHCWDDKVDGIWTGTLKDMIHHPHGLGSIWEVGKPAPPAGPAIQLEVPVSKEAKRFLDLAGPKGLDRDGWGVLLNAPVEGWPAKEITEAALQTGAIAALVPIDIEGMLTDNNPGGLYW